MPSRSPKLSRTRIAAYVLIVALSSVLIYYLTIREMRFFLVPTKSMLPTIAPHEYLLALSQSKYHRGDVIVLDDPEVPGEYLVKRIVATAGDIVDIRGGALFIDDTYVSEPYLAEPIDYALRTTYTVKENEIFVLGDNRNWSIDSHNWNDDPDGAPRTSGVPLDSVIGRIHYVYLPLRKMRPIPPYPIARVAAL